MRWTEDDLCTITGILARSVASVGEGAFLRIGARDYSYCEVDAASNRVANFLRMNGVEAGDRVATMFDNGIEAALALLGIVKTGAIAVPVNTALKMEFLRRPVMDSRARVFLIDSKFYARFAAIADSLPPTNVMIVLGNAVRGTLSWNEVLAAPADPIDDVNRPEDVAMLLYTSGTTGPSKGCMISHNYLCNLARQGVRAFELKRTDTTWTPLPLFHQNALCQMLACATVGSRLALGDHFSLSAFWKAIEHSGATVISILGSIVPLVAAQEDSEAMKRCYGQLRMVSGAPFPHALRETWKRRFGIGWAGPVGYGMTECALITGIDGPEDLPEGASGHLNAEFEVKIVDDNDREVPPDTPGELLCRPRMPHIMFEGYWQMPEATERVMKNGWYHSGDVGKLDRAGNFYFLGRKKDYLRRRGENVSLFELDLTFQAHADIEDVAAFAVPSPLGEDDIKIAAIRRASASLTEAELYEWCLDRLPAYALPSWIEFVDDLPRNPSGKVLRYKLTEQAAEGRGWSAAASRRQR